MRSRPRQISSSWCCRGGSEKPSKSSLRYCSSNSASIALHTSNSLASPGRWLSFPFDFRFFPPQNQQQFGAVVSHKWTYEDQEWKLGRSLVWYLSPFGSGRLVILLLIYGAEIKMIQLEQLITSLLHSDRDINQHAVSFGSSTLSPPSSVKNDLFESSLLPTNVQLLKLVLCSQKLTIVSH